MFGSMYGDDADEYVASSYSSAPPHARSHNHNLVGLLNQGTTCYLNSLIQTMFMSADFRSKLFELSDDELGADELQALDEQELEEERRKASTQSNDGGNGGNGGNGTAQQEVDMNAFRNDPLYSPLIEEMASTGFDSYHIDLAIRASSKHMHDREALFNWLIDNPLPDDWEALKAAELKQEQEQEAAAAARQQQASIDAVACTSDTPLPADTFKDDPSFDALVSDMAAAGFEAYHIVLALRADASLMMKRDELFNWLIDNELPENWQELYETEQQIRATAIATATATAAPKKKIRYRRIPLRLRQLFAKLQLIDEYAVSTQDLTKSFGWKGNDVGVQHDITELNRVLFDALHRSLAGTSGAELIPSLYRGMLVRNIGMIVVTVTTSSCYN
jgi:hypothetical protein